MYGKLFRPCREPQRVGHRATRSEPISIGHGMALKIFWGIKEMPGADNDRRLIGLAIVINLDPDGVTGAD